MKRKNPKQLGTGIYVHMQFKPETLVKGDTFNDADFGSLKWDGKKWVDNEQISVQTYQCSYCKKRVRRKSNKRWIKSFCQKLNRDVRIYSVPAKS